MTDNTIEPIARAGSTQPQVDNGLTIGKLLGRRISKNYPQVLGAAVILLAVGLTLAGYCTMYKHFNGNMEHMLGPTILAGSWVAGTLMVGSYCIFRLEMKQRKKFAELDWLEENVDAKLPEKPDKLQKFTLTRIAQIYETEMLTNAEVKKLIQIKEYLKAIQQAPPETTSA